MSCAHQLIDHFGGKKEAAEGMDVSQETIRLWLRDGIPLERALSVESATDGTVKAEAILREARQRAVVETPERAT